MIEKDFYIIAGCNGAGKTTAAYKLFPDILESSEFINADEIARVLRETEPGTTDIAAGRLMLTRIDGMISSGQSFTIETTLASKSLAAIIKKTKQCGYHCTLIYFWLESPAQAIERVRARVEAGGHSIPPDVIVRRYYNGLRNLFRIYIPLADYWNIYNNSRVRPVFIAEGWPDHIEIKKSSIFTSIIESSKDIDHGRQI